MNEFIKTLNRPHKETDLKVSAANETLRAHPRYPEIEGVEFVHGTVNPDNVPVLSYKTPEHFTEKQILLAEEIVNSLPSLK